jgi:hypothetical protein
MFIETVSVTAVPVISPVSGNLPYCWLTYSPVSLLPSCLSEKVGVAVIVSSCSDAFQSPDRSTFPAGSFVSLAFVAVQSPAGLPPAVIVPFAESPSTVPVISTGIACPLAL